MYRMHDTGFHSSIPSVRQHQYILVLGNFLNDIDIVTVLTLIMKVIINNRDYWPNKT